MPDTNLVEQPKPETGELQIAKTTAEVRAEIEGAIVSAKNFPRNEAAACQGIIDACKNPKLARIARYSYKRGTGKVEGISVNLAREAARIWENIRFGLSILRDDEDERTIEGWAWDVQTNTKITMQDSFKKLIYRKKGGYIKPDERDLRELTNRRGAIAVRNCLLQLIPKYILDEAEDTCIEAITGSIKDPKATARKLVKAFANFGVTVEMIEGYLEHFIDLITKEEIVDLQGVYTSIKDGNSKREEYFNLAKPSTENGKPEPPKGGIDPDDLKPEKPPEPDSTEKYQAKLKEGQPSFD